MPSGLFGFCFSYKLVIDKAVFMINVHISKYLIIQDFIVFNQANPLNPKGGNYELDEGI